MARRSGQLALRQRLSRLSGWRELGPVEVEHNNDARYVLGADGARWVMKSVEVTGPNQFLAEAISYQLAALLRLPVPEGACGGSAAELAWFSRHVPHTTHYSPARLPLTTAQMDFGRALVLDVWVLNEDRHAGNILLAADAGLFSPWFIDFGSAVIGHPRDYEERVDSVPREGQFAARTVSPTILIEGVDAGLCDVEALAEVDILGAVSDACALVGLQADAPALSDAVLKRRAALPVLTRAFLARLGVT